MYIEQPKLDSIENLYYFFRLYAISSVWVLPTINATSF